LDDEVSLKGKTFLGIPVLGLVRALSQIDHDAVIVAIGDNKTRQALFERLHASGETFVTACHPSAIRASDVSLGPGSMISAGVIINPGSRVGANTILNTGSLVEHHNVVGDHVHIGPGAVLGGEVHIGTGTLVGLGAKVMRGRKVGNGCTIGAGAVVLKDVEDHQVVFGVPARGVVKEAP
jgi:sugar O-acyltransferase (sialic acid O-acetyltransferase NeuD family)